MTTETTALRHIRSALTHIDNARRELRLARRTSSQHALLEKAIVALNQADVAALDLEVKAQTTKRGAK